MALSPGSDIALRQGQANPAGAVAEQLRDLNRRLTAVESGQTGRRVFLGPAPGVAGPDGAMSGVAATKTMYVCMSGVWRSWAVT